MIREVQYGPAVASVYDSLIAPAMPAGDAIARLRPHLVGARALEVGVGTGRVAVPAAAVAAELVGVDNSGPMLDEFRAKGVPANVRLVRADFREPLPLDGRFDAAYSTMGSIACVASRDELVTALSHVRDVLVPGAPLLFEYYATAAYRPLVELGSVTVPTPHHGGSSTFTITLDGADLLTMHTRVDAAPLPTVEFSERVLLIERAEVENCLLRAGFLVEQFWPAEGMQPYDWYLTRNGGK
ncbi:class I SAM-dependent methyltransferase [Micromonospora sp. PLK6-60]|uniref:methyltransferase domain-containing protein n=1 Tax=Micromonospora sp. PLK6-60 TaxID=2873383 RepID=UPI001CA73569|nr:class I SAM-dependent methyltransferase [Micromonospora sp. PLK6-60]MBY8870994.1 class I SAM-dependent methyltransferase [Micromonospora sp. PLK6-60]